MRIFIDVETDGLVNFKKPWSDPCQPHILSIGAVAMADDGQTEVGSLYTIIRPNGFVIDNNCEAVKINGITQEIAMSCGINLKAALIPLEHLCHHSDRIVIYNSKFEAAMFEIERVRLQRETVCIQPDKTRCLMLAMAAIIKKPGMYESYAYVKFKDAYKHIFGEEPYAEHHALHDARATAWLTAEVVKQELWQID